MTIFTVTNNNNTGLGSLRWALAQANSNEGLDSIAIESDVTLTTALNVTDDVNIYSLMGNTITQTGNTRLFNIDDSDETNTLDVSFDGLKLTGGAPVSTGGAILSYENLSLVDVEVFGNATTKRGGGVYQEGGSLYVRGSKFYDNDIAKGSTSAGGGIYIKAGELEIVGSTFENNSAIAGGGVDVFSGATAKISGSKFFRNDGSAIVAVDGSQLELSNSEIRENKSDIAGGGIIIESATATITNVEVFGNFAPYGGGIEVSAGADVKIVDSTITGNSSLEAGGGIDVYANSTLEVINSTISTNSSNFGGGIASDDTNDIRLVDTIVERNTIGDIAGDDIDVITTETPEPETPEPPISEPPILVDEDLSFKGTANDDELQGGNGNDFISGRAGNDTIFGWNGNDTLKGSNDDDRLFGNAGDDLLQGDGGRDILVGGFGNDILKGGAGNDILKGNVGDDKLVGDDGDDLLYGGLGNNTLRGGAGSDKFIIEANSDNRILDFELGTDIIGLSNGLTYDDLTIGGNANNTVLSYEGERIASISGVAKGSLTVESFQDF